MRVSLAITNYNRFKMLIESFEKVISDVRLSEIVICDDRSTDGSYEKLQHYFKANQKVKMFRNAINLGMAANKARAVELCMEDWVIIFDSDNVIDTNYLDALDAHFSNDLLEVVDNIIRCPSFAMPNFDYSMFSGNLITRDNINYYMGNAMFRCFLNTCNYVVPRKEYLKVYEYDSSVKASDTITFNYNWLKKSKYFFIVPNMTYHHRVHDGSGFLQDVNYNMEKAKEIEQKIMELTTKI